MNVAAREEVEAFASQRVWTPQLQGVLTEIATTGVIRYTWQQLTPLLCCQLEIALRCVEPELRDDTRRGTWYARLSTAILSATAPPFTTQRLAEILLEPKKQYQRLDKLGSALEKLLSVTTSISVDLNPPPRPQLDSLPAVNENPSDVRFRHVAACDVFHGFLEERVVAHPNGSSNFTSHVLMTDSPPITPSASSEY